MWFIYLLLWTYNLKQGLCLCCRPWWTGRCAVQAIIRIKNVNSWIRFHGSATGSKWMDVCCSGEADLPLAYFHQASTDKTSPSPTSSSLCSVQSGLTSIFPWTTAAWGLVRLWWSRSETETVSGCFHTSRYCRRAIIHLLYICTYIQITMIIKDWN